MKKFPIQKRKGNFKFLSYYFKQHTMDNIHTSKYPNTKWENIIYSNKITEKKKKKFRLITNSIKYLISWCNEAKALATPKRSKAVWIKIDPRAATGWPREGANSASILYTFTASNYIFSPLPLSFPLFLLPLSLKKLRVYGTIWKNGIPCSSERA